jgi:hypothetical protein
VREMTNAERDAEVLTLDAKRNRALEPRIKLVAFDQIQMNIDRAYLVKGIIPYPGLTVIWGPPKCGKSFWTLDVVMSVVLGTEYRGRRVHQGPIVYCAFEGQSGIQKRIEAYRQRHLAEGAEGIQFFLQPVTIDLVKEQQDLIAAIRASGVRPVAVVLDTLNRSLNGSESSDEDMSAYVRASDAIRESFDCAVIVVHHCGINDSRPRGHTSLTGAADAQLSVKRDHAENIVVTVEYMKDGEAGAEISSKLELFEIGMDKDGDPITCGVLVAAEAPAKAVRDARLKPNEQTYFSILQDAGQSLSLEDWNEKAREAGLGIRRRTDLHDYRRRLLKKGLVYEGMNGWSVNS